MRRERARAYILALRSTATRSDTRDRAKALDELVAALQAGVCDEAGARRLYTLGPDAVTLALLAAARRIAEQDAQLARLEAQAQTTTAGVSPSTPSGMRPIYTKPNVVPGRGRRHKRPGAKDGHPGYHRPPPPRIDDRKKHRLPICPCCGGPLQRCNRTNPRAPDSHHRHGLPGRLHRTRTRLIEDLPENLQSVVTEHTIHRDYCPKCKKHVEPVVPDALPDATFGHRLISFTSWCHYGLGVTLDQLIDILQFHLRTKLSAGGDPAEEQPVESVGPRGGDAGRADEHLPHAASPRPRPAADPRGGPSKPTCKPANSRHYPPQPLPAGELFPDLFLRGLLGVTL